MKNQQLSRNTLRNWPLLKGNRIHVQKSSRVDLFVQNAHYQIFIIIINNAKHILRIAKTLMMEI